MEWFCLPSTSWSSPQLRTCRDIQSCLSGLSSGVPEPCELTGLGGVCVNHTSKPGVKDRLDTSTSKKEASALRWGLPEPYHANLQISGEVPANRTSVPSTWSWNYQGRARGGRPGFDKFRASCKRPKGRWSLHDSLESTGARLGLRAYQSSYVNNSDSGVLGGRCLFYHVTIWGQYTFASNQELLRLDRAPIREFANSQLCGANRAA